MPSMFIHLANAHPQIPSMENFPLGLRAECGKAHWYAEARGSDRECCYYWGVWRGGLAQASTHQRLCACPWSSQTHRHTHPGHRYVPGPVGNPCLAKELSEPLRSPVSLTRVEKAWAAGEEWGVEWVSLCITGFGRPLLANYGYATAVERALLQRQINYDFVLMRENWCGRASS